MTVVTGWQKLALMAEWGAKKIRGGCLPPRTINKKLFDYSTLKI
jgi:hypothetical protein